MDSKKGTEAAALSRQFASTTDWRLIANIPFRHESQLYDSYSDKLHDLTKRHFKQKEGSVYLTILKRGIEYDIDSGDPYPTSYGKANAWELNAYRLNQSTYTPVPVSDDSGTYIAAYTPIVNNGKVIGLVATEFDTAPPADLYGIVRSAFWKSMVLAFLVSVVISYILAGMFVQPSDVVRQFQEATKLSRLDNLQTRYELSDKENEVLALLGQGLTDNQIAERLTKSPYTIKSHLKSIYRKSGLERWELIVEVQARQSSKKPA